MIVIITKVQVNWGDAFKGYLPSKYIFSSGGIYTCAYDDDLPIGHGSFTNGVAVAVGIIGATVMPHSLFLGSALATQDRISFRAPQDAETGNTVNRKETDDSLQDQPSEKVDKKGTDNSLQNQPSEKISHLMRLYENFKKFILNAFLKPPANLRCYDERQNNSFEFVRAHIYHGMFDIVGSLLGFAVMINSLYVIRHFLLLEF